MTQIIPNKRCSCSIGSSNYHKLSPAVNKFCAWEASRKLRCVWSIIVYHLPLPNNAAEKPKKRLVNADKPVRLAELAHFYYECSHCAASHRTNRWGVSCPLAN